MTWIQDNPWTHLCMSAARGTIDMYLITMTELAKTWRFVFFHCSPISPGLLGTGTPGGVIFVILMGSRSRDLGDPGSDGLRSKQENFKNWGVGITIDVIPYYDQ